jgi:hypothetical protein
MSAQRKAIRHAVIAILKAANTIAGQKVEGSRFTETVPQDMPVIYVYTLDDDADEGSQNTAPRLLDRHIDIVIEALAGAKAAPATPIDDVLDDFGEQIETALGADLTLNETVLDSVFEEASIGFGKLGDRNYGRLMIRISAVYQKRWDRDGALDDLERVDVRTDIAALPSADEARDQIEIEQ